MAKLMITTQVYENYGSADVPYWKAKGGNILDGATSILNRN